MTGFVFDDCSPVIPLRLPTGSDVAAAFDPFTADLRHVLACLANERGAVETR
jgi:hypothetical protein